MEQDNDTLPTATPDFVSSSTDETFSAEQIPPALSTQSTAPSTTTSPNERDVSEATHAQSSTNVHLMVRTKGSFRTPDPVARSTRNTSNIDVRSAAIYSYAVITCHRSKKLASCI
ncbi:hypothetical protein V6N12_052369 [Hibiscus sabdariffa]|uniref:Uncharacterized protein n=1 Tax=Hibiscus sabdariffa TaxID=183260 RepID=A0ABR2GI12_9ROSI